VNVYRVPIMHRGHLLSHFSYWQGSPHPPPAQAAPICNIVFETVSCAVMGVSGRGTRLKNIEQIA
jgi:hypothetical protein